MLRDHGIEISMDGRGRCHDNIFVERLWWTVKHEWVYLRPAANGIEQKRSLAEFFDWYKPASHTHLSMPLKRRDFVDQDAVPRGVLRGSERDGPRPSPRSCRGQRG